MRVHLVDPSAFTPPYDHALARALAGAGLEVELITSRFAYGAVPAAEGYDLRELFYRHASGPAGSGRRRAAKAAEHVPDMLRYRRLAREAGVVHFQWLDLPWFDPLLLPRRPTVLTAHDLLPREPRPGQVRAQRRLYDAVDAVIVHSRYGRRALTESAAVDPAKVHVVPHGAFEHLTRQGREQPLPPELELVSGPVALFFGLLRPYKGLETLLEAWRGIELGELWIVGRARMPIGPLREQAPAGVRLMPWFVSDAELPAYFRRADVVVLPYSETERFDQSGVLATALAFGKPSILSDIGGFGEVAETGAAQLVPADDPDALRAALATLLTESERRREMAAAALEAAHGPYSWRTAATRTISLYEQLLRAA